MEMPEFSAKVKEAIKIDGMIRYLADRHEVAESTVMRWASGNSNPHPHARKMVVESIDAANKELIAERARSDRLREALEQIDMLKEGFEEDYIPRASKIAWDALKEDKK